MGGDALTQCGSCTHALHLGGRVIQANITRDLCSGQISAWGRRIRSAHGAPSRCKPRYAQYLVHAVPLHHSSGAHCSRTLPGALTACSRPAPGNGAVDTEFRIPFPIASAQDTRLAIAVDKYGYLVSSTPHS